MKGTTMTQPSLTQPSLAIRIRKLVIGIVALLLFSNVFLPALTRSCDKLEYMANALEEQNIDPSRYYYTDIEAVGDANHEVSNTLRFMPHGQGPLSQP
jgi:hypothetical protein